MEMRKIIGRDVPIYYHNFNEIFITHADARKMIIVVVINGKW